MSAIREEKASVNDIYEILEEQKKLEDMKKIINGTLDKVNQAIKAIAIENIILTSELADEEEEEMSEPSQIKKEPISSPIYTSYHVPAQVSTVNSQDLDLQAYPLVYNEEEVETDEDLDQL